MRNTLSDDGIKYLRKAAKRALLSPLRRPYMAA
jgi:hypothetical protein